MKPGKKQTEFHPDHETPVSRFRCWDGTVGCETNKPESEFRWHPLICSMCCAALTARYGFKQSEIGYLSLLLSVDAGMDREAVYAKAPAGNVEILRRGQEGRLRGFYDKILKAGTDSKEIERLTMAYRAWFRKQAFGTKDHIPAVAAVPVGDR